MSVKKIYAICEWDKRYYWVTEHYWLTVTPDERMQLLEKIDNFFGTPSWDVFGPVFLRGLSAAYYFKTSNMPHLTVTDNPKEIDQE